MPKNKKIIFNNKYSFNLEVKSSFLQKLRGLLGVQYLEKNQGIILTKCKQVHTIGMKFPIDLVVLNRRGRIIDFISELKPGKIGRYYKNAYYMIEIMTDDINKQLFKKNIIIF